MNRTKKSFDSVKMMRSSRDKISAAIKGLTLEEELQWLASQVIEDPSLQRIRDRLNQQAKLHMSRGKVPGGS